MCIEQRRVENPYTHRIIYTKCGKCTSCMEEKNRRRESLIRNHHLGSASNLLSLFVTLNYSNDFVPYIRFSDIEKYKNIDICSSFGLPVYRKNKVVGYYYNRHTNKYKVKIEKKETVIKKLSPLDSFKLFHRYEYNKENKNTLTPLTNDSSKDKIGVCVNTDAALFIKRLRSYLDYRELPSVHSYYKTSEYGPTTSRPHFHLEIVFNTSKKDYKTFSALRTAICSCWQYSSFRQRYRNVEIARNPSAYISRYVSRGTDCSSLLEYKEFRAKSSHSIHYGFCSDFSPKSIYLRYQEDITSYSRSYFDAEKKCTVTSEYEYPSYVLYRYFPRPKGFRFLSDSELLDVYTFTTKGRCLLHSAGNTFYEIDSFRRRVLRGYFFFKDILGNYYDYIFFINDFYKILFMNKMRRQHCIIESYSYSDIFDWFPLSFTDSVTLSLTAFTGITSIPDSISLNGEKNPNSLFTTIKRTNEFHSLYLSHLKKSKDTYRIYQTSPLHSEESISKSFNSKNFIYGKHSKKTKV